MDPVSLMNMVILLGIAGTIGLVGYEVSTFFGGTKTIVEAPMKVANGVLNATQNGLATAGNAAAAAPAMALNAASTAGNMAGKPLQAAGSLVHGADIVSPLFPNVLGNAETTKTTSTEPSSRINGAHATTEAPTTPAHSGGLLSNIAGKITSGAGQVMNAAKGAGEGVGGVVSGGTDAIKGGIGSLTNAVGGVVSGGTDAIKGGIGSLTNAFGGFGRR